MNRPRDFLDDAYDPMKVMARICHLPVQAQRDIEQISRILRAAFGYDVAVMPEAGRIESISLTGPCADRDCTVAAITGYDFHIRVNLPECAEEVHWRFARRLIASEIGVHRPVTLAVEAGSDSAGIILYDAKSDLPLNAREMTLKP